MRHCRLAIVISIIIHSIAMLWDVPPVAPSKQPRRRPKAPLKITLAPPKPQVKTQPPQKPAPVTRAKPKRAFKPKPRQQPKAQTQAKASKVPESGASVGSISAIGKGEQAVKGNGYTALLPGGGTESALVQESYQQGQRDSAIEQALAGESEQLSSVTLRLAQMLATNVSLSTRIQKHLGFSRASVLLVNHPSRGLYLKNLRGEPILRALLYDFLVELPGRDEWQSMSRDHFAVTLELGTELGDKAGTDTKVSSNTLSHVFTSKRVSVARKWLAVSESPEGTVQGGINILALLEPLLAGPERDRLSREIRRLKASRGFREEVRFLGLPGR